MFYGDKVLNSHFTKKTNTLALIFSIFVCLKPQLAICQGGGGTDKVENELFSANAQLAMAEKDYKVTAGDVYTLAFYQNGAGNSYTIIVDSTYKIKIANLGTINCENLSFIQLKKNIETLVMRNYPLSVVTFAMLQPSVFNVLIKGEVFSAHETKAWALTRLSDILPNAELTQFSSTRNIKIKSANGKTKTCDLFKAKRNANFSENPYLRPGDEIEFSRTNRKVSISGSVERPGTYELLKDENLSELINVYAKGATKTANLLKIQLLRFENSANQSETHKKIIYLDKDSVENNFLLADMDSIYIPDQNEIQSFIEVKGVIKNPANGYSETDAYNARAYNIYRRKLSFFTAETYASLLRRNRDLFTVFSDLENIYIQRENEQIKLDAAKILDDLNFENEIFVQKGDEMIVPYKALFGEDGCDGEE